LGTVDSGSFAALSGMLLYALATLAVSTVVCAGLAKLFARQVSLRRLIVTCFKAFGLILLLGFVVRIAVTLAGMRVPSGLGDLLGIASVCAVGWLITHDLKGQGVAAKFPGVGAKVMTCYLLLSLALVVGVIWAVGA
jgi:hypothetical protein